MPGIARKKLASYRNVQKSTTTPAQRVVMCYDAIIRDLNQADAAFDDTTPDRFAVIHNALSHATQIIMELKGALDPAVAPELCDTLSGLYAFWIEHLSEANAKKDRGRIGQVREMLKELRDTWHEANRKAASGQGTSSGI